MPLAPGHSREVIKKNIEKLMAEGYSRLQAVAIALHNTKKKKENK